MCIAENEICEPYGWRSNQITLCNVFMRSSWTERWVVSAHVLDDVVQMPHIFIIFRPEVYVALHRLKSGVRDHRHGKRTDQSGLVYVLSDELHDEIMGTGKLSSVTRDDFKSVSVKLFGNNTHSLIGRGSCIHGVSVKQDNFQSQNLP